MINRRGAVLALFVLAACAETPPAAPGTPAPRAASAPAPAPSNLPVTGQAGTERAISTLQQDLDRDRADERLRSYDPHAQHQDLSPPRTPYEIGANTRLPTRR
ncbi:MAG: hypothetical protein INF75_04020 [Roseomonas sp.]|nr:hypothetical protein [Roseomonas sp.]MCA3326577.1 hypothetical protein [Roseomonas sp.]MCA3331175.1 hypothetical protein [Roseomonas sp.]MCA3334827.1 hypothetical protein [Roseomonas sp.]MCA3352775.1 hypothetical protein [Roseomonas sp.]